jgi:hypothetical protein
MQIIIVVAFSVSEIIPMQIFGAYSRVLVALNMIASNDSNDFMTIKIKVIALELERIHLFLKRCKIED